MKDLILKIVMLTITLPIWLIGYIYGWIVARFIAGKDMGESDYDYDGWDETI